MNWYSVYVTKMIDVLYGFIFYLKAKELFEEVIFKRQNYLRDITQEFNAEEFEQLSRTLQKLHLLMK